jgi:hypothetical protein
MVLFAQEPKKRKNEGECEEGEKVPELKKSSREFFKRQKKKRSNTHRRQSMRRDRS